MSERTYIEVIMVEPLEAPKVIQLQDSLEAMQEAVQGNIEEYMPFTDEVAIICNEDGKCTGMPLNRGIFDENGQLIDIIAGPFFIAYAPIESENFLSLPEDLKQKYMQEFKHPQEFVMTGTGIKAIPMLPQRDDFER